MTDLQKAAAELHEASMANLAEIKRRFDIAIEALKWYANEDNYVAHRHYVHVPAEAEEDKGLRARNALRRIMGEDK